MKKKKGKKKIIVFTLILLIVALFIGFKVFHKEEEVKTYQTEIVERRTIANSISATGTLTSSTSKSISSSLQGMKIDKVYVEQGNYVNEGDLLLEFDVSTLEDAVSQAQETLDDLNQQKKDAEKQTNKPNTQPTQIELNELKSQIATAEDELASLKEILEQKESALSSYENTYQTEKQSFDSIQEEYNSKNSAITQAQNDYSTQQLVVDSKKVSYDKYFKEVDNVVSQVDEFGNIIPKESYELEDFATPIHKTIFDEYTEAQDELARLNDIIIEKQQEKDAYQGTYNEALNNFGKVQEEYNRLTMEKQFAENEVSSKQTQVDLLKATYDSLQQTLNGLSSSLSGSFDLSSSLQGITSSLDSSIKQLENQINTYKKQIENKQVFAPTSGLITILNVKEGDTYMGTPLLTIEGDTQFIVESQIDEYDIPDIKEGMKVLIKTDATRNDELEGEVIFVSPSATTSASAYGITSSSSSATYKIEIAVNTKNDRLRLGMNARLSIITEQKENVLTVPFASIHEREDGIKYVEVLNEDNTVSEIVVQTALEGSYYIEVLESSDLKEGMKVILPDADSGTSIEDLIGNMGAGGGLR